MTDLQTGILIRCQLLEREREREQLHTSGEKTAGTFLLSYTLRGHVFTKTTAALLKLQQPVLLRSAVLWFSSYSSSTQKRPSHHDNDLDSFKHAQRQLISGSSPIATRLLSVATAMEPLLRTTAEWKQTDLNKAVLCFWGTWESLKILTFVAVTYSIHMF